MYYKKKPRLLAFATKDLWRSAKRFKNQAEGSNYFSEVKIHKSKDWFLPKEMENLKELMYKLKKLEYINFSEKFGKIICNTAIAVCKGPKNK